MADDNDTTFNEGVDDAADTASGGLQNDMPGVPQGQPPGRPPSPLAALAQLFTGRPAPMAAQPGRSPYNFPGMSQINPRMGGAPGPQGRWQGTTASIGLPQGSIQPRAAFTPFISSAPTDHHSQWGEEELFPDLPQSHELPGIYGNLADFFTKNGATSIIPLAMSMKLNVGQFVQGLIKGQEWQSKMARQRLQDDAYKLQLQQEEMLHVYSDTVDEYAAGAHQTDPNKIGDFVIGGRTLLDALGEDAIRLGDKNMEALVANGDVDAVIKYNHWRNDNLRNLQKANTAQEKQDAQDREEQSIWGQTFGGGAQQQNVNPAENIGGGTQPAAQPSAFLPGQGKPAPTMTSEMPADQNQGRQQTSDAPTAPSQDTPWANDAPDVQQAERLMATGRGVKLEDKRANDWITSRALAMQDRIDKDILKNPAIGPDVVDKNGFMISSPVEDALNREFGGHFAEDSRGITYYTAGLGGGQTGGGGGGGPEQNYNKLLQDLAGKRRPGNPSQGVPGYQQRNYQLITDFEKNNNVSQTVGRFTNLATEGEQLNEALDNIPSNVTPEEFARQMNGLQGTGLGNAISNITGGKFTGAGWAVSVANAWNNYNISKNVLLRGGVGGVGETERSQTVVPPLFSTAEDYRRSLVQDAQTVYERGQQLKQRFRDLGGQGDPPGWDRGAFDRTKGLANLEPVNNKEPGEIVSTPNGPAYWRGYYDENGNPIPKNKRYDPVNPLQ